MENSQICKLRYIYENSIYFRNSFIEYARISEEQKTAYFFLSSLVKLDDINNLEEEYNSFLTQLKEDKKTIISNYENMHYIFPIAVIYFINNKKIIKSVNNYSETIISYIVDNLEKIGTKKCETCLFRHHYALSNDKECYKEYTLIKNL